MSNPLFSELVQRYCTAGVLVDTNILLLLFVGSIETRLIKQFKRTRERFEERDFDLIMSFLALFKSRIVTTPHILTEVSNLAGQLGSRKKQFFPHFAKGISRLIEHYEPSANLARAGSFAKFGLTDAAIINLVQDQFLVLTDDFPLANYLSKQGVDVINFNHLRFESWSSAKRLQAAELFAGRNETDEKL